MAEWIVAIIELCRSAFSSGKVLKEWRNSELTERECELLGSAAKDGIFHVAQNDFDGRFIATNKKEFTDPNDPAVAAHYLDAFIRLCDRGLVIDQNEEIFRLTGQGFDLGRKLSQ